MRHIFYLHGFGSSPDSTKGRELDRRLRDRGLELLRPDLNGEPFEKLTVSRMIDTVEREIGARPTGPVVLIGSSLGAFVAWHLAARRAAAGSSSHPIERLVLLAPALDFGGNRAKHLGEEGLARWRATNRLEVFHHAENRMRAVEFGLFEDGSRYDSFAVRLDIPVLIFQGRLDEVVDPQVVESFAGERPNVTLRLLDDDHQLHASMETIWEETAAFLSLGRRP